MGGLGFPTLMFLDAEGRKLLQPDGPRTTKAFEDALAEVGEFQALEKKAGAGDGKAAAELLIRQLRLQWFDLEEARKRVEALEKVTASQKKELAQLLVDTEVRGVVNAAGEDTARRIEAGEHFRAMWDDKRTPSAEPELYAFWFLMADFAERDGDKKLFKRIMGELKDALPNGVQKNRFLSDMERRLESISK